jgi:hypothetical protein
MKDAARLRSLYQLSSAERNQTLSDLWSQTVLRELAKLTPEELVDLREATFTTEKMRELDQYSLGALLSLRGLSPEAIEMLGVAWGYETSPSSNYPHAAKGAVEHRSLNALPAL